MIPWLDSTAQPRFPPVADALVEPNGLLAAGGSLSCEWLSAAYARGIFPWFNQQDPILWWSPNPRMVLFPENFHRSKSLKRCINSGRYSLTQNACFTAVVDRCAQPRASQPSTWITAQMRAAYDDFHNQGLAVSYEVWEGQELVGGVYGPLISGVFFGESMFSSRDNASKYALYRICEIGKKQGLKLIDCQFHSNHLASLGAGLIPRSEFLNLLAV